MFKKVIKIIAGLAAVIIILALVAPAFISVDTYKNQIIAKVEAATGRTLTIDGKLSISFFPVAGITAENVTLSNPAGFEDKNPLARLSSVTVEVAVLPLLNKDIVIKNFVLKDPDINLFVTKDGRKNWVFAPHTATHADNEKKSSGNSTSDNEQAPSAESARGGFVLNNFELKNGTVHYAREGNAFPMELEKINASMVLQSSATAATINGSMELNGKTVNIKIGIGTMQSLLEEQKMEINATIKSDLLFMSLKGNYDKGSFTGNHIIKSDSLKELAEWVTPGKPMSTPAKLEFQSESDVKCINTHCELPKLHLVIDAVDAKGNLQVSWAPRLSIDSLNLTTDKLDLNPFLPPEQHAGLTDGFFISDAVAALGERWSSEPIDLAALNQLNANVNIEAGGIKFRNITAGKTVLNAKLQQGVLTSDITTSSFYQGSGTVSSTINASQSPAEFNTNIMLKSVHIEPLLKDAVNKDNMTGIADIQVSLKSNVKSVHSLISDLSGTGQIRVVNGELRRIALLDMLHNNQNAFGNTSAQSTAFSFMGGSFSVAQGVVSNHDFAMTMQGMNVNGSGDVNLPAYTVNYRLTPQVVTTAQDASGASTTKEGLSVPVIIEGSLDAPKFRPDIAATIQNAIKDPKQFKEQLKNSKGVIKNLKGLLQGLQGR